jgi:hypothetical protein
MANSHLRLVTPATENRTVTPKRCPNAELRTREHLTEAEVERLMDAARKNRWGHRDATMVLVAYRHGLRPAELVDLRWDQVEFGSGALHIRRVKEARPARIRSWGTSYGLCGAFSASRSPSRRSSSLRSAAPPSAPLASPAWSSALALKPSSVSKPTRTCCGTHAVTLWRTKGTIRARSKLISGTGISNIRCATPNCRRRGFGISGESESVL